MHLEVHATCGLLVCFPLKTLATNMGDDQGKDSCVRKALWVLI